LLPVEEDCLNLWLTQRSAVIVSLLHAFRLFFMGRFRGPRWLAWVSGVVMMVVLWLAGVSGYWLIWDQSAGWFLGGLVVVTLAVSAIPWLSFRRQQPPRVTINPARCTGCTHCWIDCPYKAITMTVPMNGSSSRSVAQVHPNLCISCGLCVGSCDANAISLGNDLSTEMLGRTIQTRLAAAQRRTSGRLKVIFTCERHAVQGASPYLGQEAAGQLEDGLEVIIIPLPCVGRRKSLWSDVRPTTAASAKATSGWRNVSPVNVSLV
jgi:ferredoxin